MNRNEFLGKLGVAGLGGLLLPNLFTACSEETVPNIDVNFNGRVLIIGAGTAGLMAGYVLKRYNIDFEILEASSVHGGRVKETSTFTVFPIDLGAEWIHTDPDVLARLLDDSSINASIDIINYSPPEISIWKNDKLRNRNYFSNFYGEHKFKNSTWYSYLNDFIVPYIEADIIYNEVVSSIDYSTDNIAVETTGGNNYTADRVIITVPLSVLKDGDINITPSLPTSKINALNDVYMPDGIKVFMEFTEDFYPDVVLEGGLFQMNEFDGDKVYYNAAFGKDTNKHIFALFCVGEQATVYVNQPNKQALIDYILNELDEYFDGKASRSFVKHISQNWTAEPFIRGSYTHGNFDVLDELKTPIDEKIFFAGETMAPNDTSTVHGAANSAWVAVERLLADRG